MAADTKVLGSIGAVYLVVFALLGSIVATLLVYSARLGVGYLIGDGDHPDINAPGATHTLWPSRSPTAIQAAALSGVAAPEPAVFAETVPAESEGEREQRLRAANTAYRNAEEAMAFEEAWSADGSWQGVACDPVTGDIYALNSLGEVVCFDLCGEELGRVRLDLPIQSHPSTFPNKPPATLRLANLVGDERPEFLVLFDSNYRVGAFDMAGNQLWIYSTPTGDSAHDLWPVPQLQDPETGFEPVLVGYDYGVHLINSDGTTRWISPSSTKHVCVGRTGAEGDAEILATDMTGEVFYLDQHGYYVRSLQTGVRMITCMALLSPPEAYPEPALIVGDGFRRQFTTMFASERSRPSVAFPHATFERPSDVAVAESLPWFAAAFYELTVRPLPGSQRTSMHFDDGVVALYDVLLGERLASVAFHARQLAWTPPTPGRLPSLIAAGESLRVYDLRAKRPSRRSDASEQP